MYKISTQIRRKYAELVRKVCQALSLLNLEVGPSGNMSARETFDTLFITPSGANFSDISLEYIAEVGIASPHIYKNSKPSSDLASHIEIYKKRPDIKAIVHTHAHFVTLAAMIGSNIPVLNTMHADYFYKPIRCTPFSNHRKTGLGLVEYFAEGEVFLLGKHGGLLFFKELDEQKIVNTMQAFNEICKLYYHYLAVSHTLTEDVQEISQDDLERIHTYYQSNYGKKTSS